MPTKFETVERYLASLPADRREALSAVRRVILKNLDKNYAEGIQYGMIGYFVPHSVYPAGYHCDPTQPLPFAGLASQKNYMSIYLMCVYGSAETRDWFCSEWKKTGKRLDMGKACIRFKRLDDLPLDLIGRAIARVPAKKYVADYESMLSTRKPAKKPATKKSSLSKAGSKKPVAKRKAKRSAK